MQILCPSPEPERGNMGSHTHGRSHRLFCPRASRPPWPRQSRARRDASGAATCDSPHLNSAGDAARRRKRRPLWRQLCPPSRPASHSACGSPRSSSSSSRGRWRRGLLFSERIPERERAFFPLSSPLPLALVAVPKATRRRADNSSSTTMVGGGEREGLVLGVGLGRVMASGLRFGREPPLHILLLLLTARKNPQVAAKKEAAYDDAVRSPVVARARPR